MVWKCSFLSRKHKQKQEHEQMVDKAKHEGNNIV